LTDCHAAHHRLVNLPRDCRIDAHAARHSIVAVSESAGQTAKNKENLSKGVPFERFLNFKYCTTNLFIKSSYFLILMENITKYSEFVLP